MIPTFEAGLSTLFVGLFTFVRLSQKQTGPVSVVHYPNNIADLQGIPGV